MIHAGAVSIPEILGRCWNNFNADEHPRDRRMQGVIKIPGMGTENICFLINEIIRQVCEIKGDCTYLEFGVYQGRSLLSAAAYNPKCRAIGVDDFSQFDKHGKNEGVIRHNIKALCLANVELYRCSFDEFDFDGLTVDVFYSDGEHSYENQQKALELVLPHLAHDCLIFVDDYNYESVDRSNAEFLSENLEFRSVFKKKSDRSSCPKWWNGFEVIQRGYE